MSSLSLQLPCIHLLFLNSSYNPLVAFFLDMQLWHKNTSCMQVINHIVFVLYACKHHIINSCMLLISYFLHYICIDNVCAGHVHTYVVHIHIFVRNVILLTAIHFFFLYYIFILSIHSLPLVIVVFGGTFMHHFE